MSKKTGKVGVVVHLDDYWNYTQSDRDIDIMQLYTETIKALNADIFIIIDQTEKGMVHKHNSLDIKCETYKSLPEALKKYSKFTKLYFEHSNALSEKKYTTLEKLKHPKSDCLYIFGSDIKGLNFSNIKLGKNDKIITIEVSKYILWTVVATSLALYDRSIKQK